MGDSLRTHCKRGHEFNIENTGRAFDGTRQCKTCRRQTVRDWRSKNREHFNALSRKWKSEHKEACGRRTSKWRSAHPDEVKSYKKKNYQKYKATYAAYYKRTRGRPFGLSPEQLQRETQIRENKCDICKQEQSEKRAKELHIDHDHGSNKFRGLLCGACNRGIGHFKDNPELLRNAASYLERFNG